MMDLAHMRSFAEVAERGTVAAAAQSLAFTPPAISQHIAKLEAEVGVALFDRVGRRLQLTDAGRALLPVSLQMIELERQGRAQVEQPPSRPHVRIAGFASAIASLVVPRLHQIAETMTVELIETEDADALRDLRLGAVDLVLAQEYQDHDVDRDSRMAFTPLVTDQLRLVLPADRQRSTTLDQLDMTPWLVNGHGTRCTQATMRILGAHGLTPTIAASVADNSTLLSLVAAGHGVTIMPDILVRDQPNIAVASQDLGISRTIFGVHLSSATTSLSPLLDQLRR